MCRNIYLAARQASGLTQERAAERIPVSVRSLADYEAGVRRPTTETVVRMVEIYDAQYLAYQHLRETSDLAQRLIPDVMGAELPEATLQLLDAIYDFADAHFDRRLIAIARDGKIDDSRIDASVSDLVAGRKSGRDNDDQLTYTCNVGLGLYDVAIAARVYQYAKENGIGQKLKLWDEPIMV